MRRFGLTCVISALVCWGGPEALGAFATGVVSYTPGNISPTFQDPTSALGMPAGDTSFGVLTPFNSAFLGSHIVGMGQGGSLTLQLGATAPTGQGATLGVHAAVGLIDFDYPNGFAGPVATPFTNHRSAEVLVSRDGSQWFSLGQKVFDLPTNFYSQGVTTPGFQAEPGTQVANFGKPFTRILSDFNGRDWPQILALLDGSAGGTWLDLSSVPYGGVNFVRFDVTGADQVMYVDAVSVAATAPNLFRADPQRWLGPAAVVPEPNAVIAICALAVMLRRR